MTVAAETQQPVVQPPRKTDSAYGRVQQRQQVLRRGPRRESREPGDSAGHHEPGWAEWFRQDYADELDDRLDPAHVRGVRVLGLTPDDPERFFRAVGYCTQFDSFPKGATGRDFVEYGLKLQGHGPSRVKQMAHDAIARVNLLEAADRKVAGYSKGMRQRIRLAQAIAHSPSVLVLDEPLNGLDPMARAETIALFEQVG